MIAALSPAIITTRQSLPRKHQHATSGPRNHSIPESLINSSCHLNLHRAVQKLYNANYGLLWPLPTKLTPFSPFSHPPFPYSHYHAFSWLFSFHINFLYGMWYHTLVYPTLKAPSHGFVITTPSPPKVIMNFMAFYILFTLIFLKDIWFYILV